MILSKIISANILAKDKCEYCTLTLKKALNKLRTVKINTHIVWSDAVYYEPNKQQKQKNVEASKCLFVFRVILMSWLSGIKNISPQ